MTLFIFLKYQAVWRFPELMASLQTLFTMLGACEHFNEGLFITGHYYSTGSLII
jgi:hypothetical protein